MSLGQGAGASGTPSNNSGGRSSAQLANNALSNLKLLNVKAVHFIFNANGEANGVTFDLNSLQEDWVMCGVPLHDSGMVLFPDPKTATVNPLLESPVLTISCEVKVRIKCFAMTAHSLHGL